VTPDGPFGVNAAETIAPDTDNRWMGSAAQDHQGNIGVGYSVSSLTTFRRSGIAAASPTARR